MRVLDDLPPFLLFVSLSEPSMSTDKKLFGILAIFCISYVAKVHISLFDV